MHIRRILITFIAALSVFTAVYADTPDNAESGIKKYLPRFRAAVRARWEEDFDLGKGRFQLRNARVMLDGNIASTIDYFLQADLCDRGSMKFLDGWVRLEIIKGLKIQAGQFRMPFGVEPFRAPGNYIFSNRSYIGKQICNVRAVGGKVMYTLPKTPLTFEGGIFNPTSIFDHTGWNRSYAYAGRAVWLPGNWRVEGGVMSLLPDDIRVNMYDLAVGWFSPRWDVAGEYMYEHYTHKAHKATHAYALWGDYKIPVKVGVFNQLSFQGRLDGMTAHSDDRNCDEDGRLSTVDPARNRLTIGTTLSYLRGTLGLDIRADYEKCFYRSGTQVPYGDGDRIVLELIFRF